MGNSRLNCCFGGIVALGLLFLAGCPEVGIPDPRVRYIAFGDSSTTGTDGKEYWELLQEQLGVEPVTFANQGKGGETTTDGLTRLKALLDDELYPNATTLLYWEGGNDIVDFLQEADPLLLMSPSDDDYTLTDELEELLDKAEANIAAAIDAGVDAGLDVFVATYPTRPLTVLPCEPLLIPLMLPEQAENANEYTLLLNDRIRRAADGHGAVLVDVADDPDLATDAVFWENCNHLNERGNGVVADIFEEAIRASTQPE